MDLSVIIPSHNRAHVLTRAIDSVMAQKPPFVDFSMEVIVVDDGSDDDTPAVLSAYPDVVVLRQSNSGVSAARNAGIRQASGEWLALLDSDDEWLPHKLEAQFAEIEQSGLSVCHTEEIWIRNGVRVNQMIKHRKRGGEIFLDCLPLCAMSPSSILLRRNLFTELGGFDENLPACEDYDLWLRLCAFHPVAFVSQPCIKKYGGHADQLSRRYWGMDRFRVTALEKVLAMELKPVYQQAALACLLEKLEILQQGAAKHDNHELLLQCQQKLAYWRNDGATSHA